MLCINELVCGELVRLHSFGSTEPQYRQRLLALGLTQGLKVLIVRKAPLGCPIEIEVRGTRMALRKEEALKLEWERL